MMMEDIERVAVLGAGNMGHGITEVVAMAGYSVTMRDIETEFLVNGYEEIEWSLEKLAEHDRLEEAPDTVLERIDTTTNMETAVADADLVIEAIPEDLDLKHETFSELDSLTDESAILASNTSSLPITDIAADLDSPERVVGIHFFNPPVKMDLVEVIYGEATRDETAETAYEFVESIDKTPIYVRKDVRGFVVNSVLAPFVMEAAWMASEEETEIEEADATLVYDRGYPMGPFELLDMTGIDVNYHVRKEAGKTIPPIIEEKIEAGAYGNKAGKGFYNYEDGNGVDYAPEDASEQFDWLRIEARIVNEAAMLIGDNVATADAIDTGMRLGTGFPEGSCRRGDDLGLDTVLEKLDALHDEYGADRFEAVDYLRELVEAGKTGKDAGAGFYNYESVGSDRVLARDYSTINVDLSAEGLLQIELDRPDRLNALNATVHEEIITILEGVDQNEVRAVTIEGAGNRAFSAGADITGFSDLEPFEKGVSEMYELVDGYPRPTLAKIDGFCLGGGHELALACDLRVATKDSTFGFPEINLGLIPGGGGTQRAIRMLSEARAKELVFNGERIDAERAEDWGLINRAVSEEEFEATVDEFVDNLLNGPPVALRKAKQVMNKGRERDLSAGLELEAQAFGLLLTTDDIREGTGAFNEDRAPQFEGK